MKMEDGRLISGIASCLFIDFSEPAAQVEGHQYAESVAAQGFVVRALNEINTGLGVAFN